LDEVKSSSSATSYASLDRHKTVLVADDAQQVLELAQSLLQEAQYNVLLASDGAEAMRLIREEHPDLVVLDLLMPGLTGFDVLRAMRQDERVKETPVVVMSSVYKDDVLEFLQQLGAQGFLDKNQLRETLVFRTNQILSPDNPS
jgi:CheY-like chemotaxis protein